MQKGTALDRLVKKQDALAAFTKMLEINPGNAEGWVKKGILLTDLGKIADAVTAFTKALDINPCLTISG